MNNNINKGNKKIIMSYEEIKNYNKKIIKNTNFYDIDNINKITKEKIFEMITNYKVPKLPKYNGNIKITFDIINNILNNRNLKNIETKNNIIKGIIIKRANLRSFPTNIHFYDEQNIFNFDRLQETELQINTPVLIIHESLDKLWYFVISQIYAGWIEKKCVAYTKDKDYEYFIKNKNFGIITESFLNTKDTILDMGVKLPLIKELSNSYVFEVPKKGKNNYVYRDEIIISKNNANIGYLTYSEYNLYDMAFKYLGTNYSWGSLDNGVDCSGFIRNIYQTSGFLFPRNVSSQSKSVGNIIWLNNKTLKEKLTLIDNTNPSLLFKNDHVMLYIGKINNKHYIVHASGEYKKVVITELNLNSKYLKDINKLVITK